MASCRSWRPCSNATSAIRRNSRSPPRAPSQRRHQLPHHFHQIAGNAHQSGIASQQAASHRQNRLDFYVPGRPMPHHPERKRPEPRAPVLPPSPRPSHRGPSSRAMIGSSVPRLNHKRRNATPGMASSSRALKAAAQDSKTARISASAKLCFRQCRAQRCRGSRDVRRRAGKLDKLFHQVPPISSSATVRFGYCRSPALRIWARGPRSGRRSRAGRRGSHPGR